MLFNSLQINPSGIILVANYYSKHIPKFANIDLVHSGTLSGELGEKRGISQGTRGVGERGDGLVK